jgi:hypothetical protein
LKFVSLTTLFFEPGGIFLSKQKPWHGSHPTLGENEGFFFIEKMKTIVELMVKGMLRTKANDWKMAKSEKP